MKISKKVVDVLKWFALLIVGLIFIVIFSRYVPNNMDEFGIYHTIMCKHYPNNALNTFREGCQAYDLKLFGVGPALSLREYPYIGTFSSLIYYPLFIIWKSPDSARFFGLILLFLQALILSKIFKSRPEYVFLGLIAFFPYFFQNLVNTGDVGLQCCGIFLILFLFKRWFTTHKIRYALLISVVIFLGIWIKLTFLIALPGLVLMLLMYALQNKRYLFKKQGFKHTAYAFVISIIFLFCLLSFIFLSTSPNNSSDLTYLNQVRYSQSYSFSEILNTKIFQSRLFKTLINPFETTQRIYSDVTWYARAGSVNSPNLFVYLYDFVLFLTPLFFWIFVRFINRLHKKKNMSPLIAYLAFVLTLLFVFKTKDAWAMHHIVLAFPFLIFSYLEIIDWLKNSKNGRKIILCGIIIFILMNCYFFFTFYHKEFPSQTDFSRIEINGLLKDEYLASNYFFVVIDWGMYYYQALYGDKSQSVLYMEPLRDIGQINALKDLSKKHNRKILFIYNSKVMSSDHNLIENNFVLHDCNKISADSVWKIRLEDGSDPRNICFVK